MARPKKPNGHGRRAFQKDRRKRVASEIARHLQEHMDWDAIEASGALFPRSCSLRKRKNRNMFAWLKGMKGRVFTNRVCLLVCKKLMSKPPFTLNHDPRESLETFLGAQARRLACLAKKARRMDCLETQPFATAPECSCEYQDTPCPRPLIPELKLVSLKFLHSV